MGESKKERKIMLIGSGPSVIGQSAGYDRAGLQAFQALREEGIESVVLGNDPASLVTEALWADRVYCEPLTAETIEKIIGLEQPEGILISFGGQLALNLGFTLMTRGILEKYHLKLIGFPDDLLNQTEDRSLFTALMNGAGVDTPAVTAVKELRDGMNLGKTLGFPIVVRTPFVTEGLGVNLAYNQEELAALLEKGLSVSPAHTVWLEEALLNWREYEVEALRDRDGHCLVVSLLENIEPVGIHSGDSMVVTPPQGLAGPEIKKLIEQSVKALETLGLTGEANLQWAWNPQNGEIRLLRINPRFSRSTAMAIQTTGLPMAAIALRLMLGQTLPEAAGLEKLPSDCYFQPPQHFVAVRLPRFDFARFPDTSPVLTSTMKSTGEVLAMGGNFREALQKGVRSLKTGYQGLGADRPDPGETDLSPAALKTGIVNPGPERLFYLRLGLKRGITPVDMARFSKLAEWFIQELTQLVRFEKKLSTYALYNLDGEVLRQAKREGFSDHQIAFLLRTTSRELRMMRLRSAIFPVYRKITPTRFYSTYGIATDDARARAVPTRLNCVLLIGSGPTRIGQGPEYDYCTAYAARHLQELGYSCVYLNCNPGSAVLDFAPDTVSYEEPLTAEDLLNILEREKPVRIVTQFSGTTGADLSAELKSSGCDFEVEIPDFQRTQPTEQTNDLIASLGITLPGRQEAAVLEEAHLMAHRVGFPVAVSPVQNSGLAEVAYHAGELAEIWERLLKWCKPPLRIEHLPDHATGIQLSGVADGRELCAHVTVEQIEEALVHVGDSACVLPVNTLSQETVAKLTATAARLIGEYQYKGLISILFAVKQSTIFLREFRTGDCRLVPFIQKATGSAWIKMALQAVADLPVTAEADNRLKPQLYAVKEAVFSFENFPGVDTILGPEQRSTGSALGLDPDFGLAFIKSQLGAGENLPDHGNVFVSVREEDKRALASLGKQLEGMGFGILADMETAEVLSRHQIPCQEVPRLGEGRPDILDRMKNGEVQWIINTPAGRKARREEALIRSTAVTRGIPITTTLSGAQAAVNGLENYLRTGFQIRQAKEYD